MELNSAPMLLGALVLGWAQAEISRWVFRRQHREEIARLHESYRIILETRANVEQYGTPTTPVHVVEEREPEPEVRAARVVSRETRERIAENLRHEYAVAGIKVTPEQIEEEIDALIRGESPTPSPELLPFIRD